VPRPDPNGPSDQREELIDRHFQARNRRRDDPENDQNKADKGQIVRPVRMMDQRHNLPPKVDSCDQLLGEYARPDVKRPYKSRGDSAGQMKLAVVSVPVALCISITMSAPAW
jgi:hypothetical protein